MKGCFCTASRLSSLVHVLRLRLRLLLFLKSLFVYLKKKEKPAFVEWRSGHPCWLSWEPLPIITPKNAGWAPRSVILWFDIFIMGGILSARLTYMWPRTVMVTVHEQRVKIKAPKVFNLVMVRCPAILCRTSRNPELFSSFPVSPLYFVLTVLFVDFISEEACHILLDIRLLITFQL